MCASDDQYLSAVGQRVEYQGFYGTVRFAGELTGQAGMWIGVEWDDASRGKHDGSHNGVSYFKTSHPTSGSFVRPHKLNFGISFLEALSNRYGKIEGSNAGVDEDAIEELRREFNIPFIEMVGLDKINSKQSQFENLSIVHLSREPVNGAGEQGQLTLICPSIKELGLCNTLLNSWKAVSDITVQLTQLLHLNISNNKIPVPSKEEIPKLATSFKALQTIILNNLDYCWEDILVCANMWPFVTLLSAQSNRIHTLESPSFGLLTNLTSLYLSMNPIEEWEYVNKLGNLTSLQELHLAETGLHKVFFPGESSTSLFPSLKYLDLRSNSINDWSSINELNKLLSLESLQLSFNPIMEKPKAFDMIFGRIQGLKKLNGIEITPQEHKGAENDYMKFYGREWLAARNDPILLQEFCNQHPRYPELVKRHGAFADEDFSSISAPLKSRLINVKIFCPSRPNMREFQKKLPKNMTIQKLSGLAQKLMNTEGCVPSLQAISSKTPDLAVLLDKDMQDLSFYSVEDGDSIAVSW